mmetsp:Transcript_26562/g.60496  ORF Transcript_26562/g.60496 Transcript_26562/m.60496 type:complete len:241 (-) Transcript_26562:321-1043(-)
MGDLTNSVFVILPKASHVRKRAISSTVKSTVKNASKPNQTFFSVSVIFLFFGLISGSRKRVMMEIRIMMPMATDMREAIGELEGSSSRRLSFARHVSGTLSASFSGSSLSTSAASMVCRRSTSWPPPSRPGIPCFTAPSGVRLRRSTKWDEAEGWLATASNGMWLLRWATSFDRATFMGSMMGATSRTSMPSSPQPGSKTPANQISSSASSGVIFGPALFSISCAGVSLVPSATSFWPTR